MSPMCIVRNGNDYEPQQISTHRLRELLRTEKAAVDLLDACRRAVRLLEQHTGEEALADSTLQQCRAAIAKAEGREP